MTLCPFSANGMPIKGWPKSLLGGGACSICSAILGIFYLLCPGKYSIGSCHLPCKSPCSTRYEWLCCKNAGDSTKVLLILVRVSEGTPASLVFSEGIVYSCSSSSSSDEQSASASLRTLLSGSGNMKQVFATRKGRSLCIKMLVNTFVGRAHTV